MRKILLMLACLALVGHARRVAFRPAPAFHPSGPRALSASHDSALRVSSIEMIKKAVGSLSADDLKGKRVLTRCDFNVPLDGQTIRDDTRIRKSLQTIKYLVGKGAKVLLCSHLGRPREGPEDMYSLSPVAVRLTELLGQEVKMAPDCIGDEVAKCVADMADGEVLLLENVRFYEQESANDPEFAEKLASNADLFVNDAFGTAHRAHASTTGVTQYLSLCVAGFLLQKELDYLETRIADNPQRPVAAVIGGSKVSTKFGVIESLIEKVDLIVIGGGIVFTFLKARGLDVGVSFVEEDQLKLATKLEKRASDKGIDFVLPCDVIVADRFTADASTKTVSINAIPDGWMGLDIGPESNKLIFEKLQQCQTIIWNGPMGVFEFEAFARGTEDMAAEIARLTAEGCTTIIGGGHSVEATLKNGLAQNISHISTGGAASLELLEGKVLPAVAALDDA